MNFTCLISRTLNRPSRGARVELRPKSVLIERAGRRLVLPVTDITGSRIQQIRHRESMFRSRTWWVVTIMHADPVGSGEHHLWFEDERTANQVHDTLDNRLWNRAVIVDDTRS